MSNKQFQEEWDLIIESRNSLFDLKLVDLWRYRDLLVLLVKRDFTSFYKQTIFGPLWFFIQPIFTTVVFTFIFGNLANISTDGLPHTLFYLAGITPWNYFSDCIIKTSTVFKDNSNIFGKVYFPRLIMPLSIVVSNLIRFGVQFSLLGILTLSYWWLGADITLTYVSLISPILILIMALLGLGIGLIITSLTTKYRDLAFLVSFGVQLLMYATTVIYPLSSAPEKYRIIIEANPMTFIIEAFRFGFLGKGEFSWFGLLYSFLIAFFLFIIGVFIFNRTEKNFVDTV